MTVKAKVRNRKTGVSVEVNINNKSEANNNSKNKYLPELQTNIDDQEPPPQTNIQNSIPYFNKAPSLPMYNGEGLGIPSRYANLEPQGSTNVPQGYRLGNDMNQPAIPSEYDFLDDQDAEDDYYVDMPEEEESYNAELPEDPMIPLPKATNFLRPNVSQSAELLPSASSASKEKDDDDTLDLSEIQPMNSTVAATRPEEEEDRNFSLQLSDIFISNKRKAHYEKLKTQKSKKNYEERFKDYLRRLVKSFKDPAKQLTPYLIEKYDFYDDIRHELNSTSPTRHNAESRRYYSNILKRYDSKKK